MKKYTDKEIQERLGSIPRWELRDGALERTFVFADFTKAFCFMSAVATILEEMNHHPEWSNTYKSVVVRLTTHDVGGISELDFKLAQRMDETAKTIV
jgi:4a-hydroxytetrahydrobiopterin dehydratase